jgi:NADH-quinone oxidoreductase subunit J
LALFIVVGVIAVAGALLMVLQRHPVYCALYLVVTMGCIGVFYVMLDSPLLAAVQVAVYAGAVMVLFLFVIMYLQLDREASIGHGQALQRSLSIALPLALAVIMGAVAYFQRIAPAKGPMSAEALARVGHAQLLGRFLFTDYLLPFEITSLVLLAAMIGAVVVARRG